jgi:hypothetical protein
MQFTAFVLHHSESIDPTLLDWIRHEIDAVLGLGPETIVAILGTVIVIFPVLLMLAASRQAGALTRAPKPPRPTRLERRAATIRERVSAPQDR